MYNRNQESLLLPDGFCVAAKGVRPNTCPDPLWEKYYSWTPYQYAGCNPVSRYDNNGKFSVAVHAQAENEALGTNYAVALIENTIKDAVGIVAPGTTHFDNLNSYSEVMDAVEENGGFDNMDKHTLGDFFAHSNYVDIWNNLVSEGKVNGDIPLPAEVVPGSDFDCALKDGLKTTTYPDKGNDNKGHDTGYDNIKDNKAFGAKDKTSDAPYQKELFNQAYDLFVRALKAYY
jgi:hypothetical protein